MLYNDMVNRVKAYYTIPSFATMSPDHTNVVTLDRYDYNSGEYYAGIYSDSGAVSAFFLAG